MRILFIYWAFEDQGSGLLIQSYTNAARELGPEIVVYGRAVPNIPLNYSTDIDSADAAVFIFEWTTSLLRGDALDLLRLMSKVPRRRRVILDGDGNYNDIVRIDRDYNHVDSRSHRSWIEVCDSLTDKICQPTLHPIRENVRTFLFYCYNPGWELPLDVRQKEFGLIYVGHSKFRWDSMYRVLRAVEPIRDRVGRVGVVGHGWGALPPWAAPMQMEDAYYTDGDYLKKHAVEILPAVSFGRVIDWMSKATVNPVLTRPTFNHMQLVTPRFFETVASNTIPVFGVDEAYAREIYGERAVELMLPSANSSERLMDMYERPEHYAEVVAEIRAHLAVHHSQGVRVQELVEIIES